jgi:hypothetical protein
MRVVKHFKQDIIKQMEDSALKKIIEKTPYGMFLKRGHRILDSPELLDDESLFIKTDKQAARETRKYSKEFPVETPDEFLDRVEREWEELISYKKDESVNIDGTYDYDSDDPDCEDNDIVDTDKHEVANDADVEVDNFVDIECDINEYVN